MTSTTDLPAPATTLRRVEPTPRSWAEYRGVAPDDLIEECLELAGELSGARILQVNATAYGGGVAELLSSQIGLLVDAGLAAEWRLLCPDAALFDVTKRIHNGMQGQELEMSAAEVETYERHNAHCAAMVGGGWDLVMIHDPQPLALIASAPRSGPWVWRCHIDTAAPAQAVWSLLEPYVLSYDATVFTLPGFRPPALGPQPSVAIAPAIDPLSSKNVPLPASVVERVVGATRLDPGRPLALQVSRFDPWKDPLGVVEAWRLARREVPGLQLALVGSMAEDDPEGLEIYEQVRAATSEEADCHLLTNLQGIGATEVNALQSHADVVIQKSLREGFGLTVSEALWKGKPVIGGRAGGIPLQIGDNEAGVLVDSVEACARALVALVTDGDRARRLGSAGRERVRREFLMPRLVRDELRLYRDLLAGARDR